jgi:O-antigen/teichoic acid export membrane protein
MSLAQRSVTSTGWNFAANLVQTAIFLLRSIILARLLPVEAFGAYNFAGSVIVLSATAASFGMGSAFLHRSAETEDEEHAAAIHFTLKLIFALAWAVSMIVVSFLLTDGPRRTALLVLCLVNLGMELTQTPRLILTRRIVHRRLAMLQLLNALLTTVVALSLAWCGQTLWALLATDITTLSLSLFLLYAWRPVWRPRLMWTPRSVRYFLSFGGRTFPAVVLSKALDRVDDLWTGFFLTDTALGFYSKAYSFATYPRSILAAPVNAVAMGTYAELKNDRHRLSQAFFRSNALLVRSGFYLAGVLTLIAPEFIHLVIGDKWLPMLTAFRLMLIFTLLDPIKTTVSNLFVAVGKPERVTRARILQLVVLVVGLFALGYPLGIAGVALAVDLMLFVGIAILLGQAREHVSFSAVRLFGTPTLALLIALGLASGATALGHYSEPTWWSGAIKLSTFSLTYVSLLLVIERRDLLDVFGALIKLYSRRR